MPTKTSVLERSFTRRQNTIVETVTNGVLTRTVLNPSVATSLGFRHNRTWGTLSNYRQLVRSGAYLPDQNYSLTEFILSGGRVGHTTSWSGPVNNRTRSIVTDSAEWYANRAHPPVSLTSRADLIFRLQAKQRDNEWNAPVFLAEARKTSLMVAQRAGHLVGLLRALRRGDANRFLDGLRTAVEGTQRRALVRDFNRTRSSGNPRGAAANIWLETTYGWTPFVGDVHNAMNTLMDMADREGDRTGTTSVRVRSSRQWQTAPYILNPYVVYDFIEATESRRMVWHWEPLPGTIPARLGLLNPAVVAWELLPFSFVADWFLPVGNYLSQLDMAWRVSHKGGAEGYRLNTVRKTVITGLQGDPSGIANGMSTGNVTTVTRTPLTGIPVVGLGDVRLDPNVGARRAVSAVSLLQQNIPRVLGLLRRGRDVPYTE